MCKYELNLAGCDQSSVQQIVSSSSMTRSQDAQQTKALTAWPRLFSSIAMYKVLTSSLAPLPTKVSLIIILLSPIMFVHQPSAISDTHHACHFSLPLSRPLSCLGALSAPPVPPPQPAVLSFSSSTPSTILLPLPPSFLWSFPARFCCHFSMFLPVSSSPVAFHLPCFSSPFPRKLSFVAVVPLPVR